MEYINYRTVGVAVERAYISITIITKEYIRVYIGWYYYALRAYHAVHSIVS